jgi:hypothetical protein
MAIPYDDYNETPEAKRLRDADNYRRQGMDLPAIETPQGQAISVGQTIEGATEGDIAGVLENQARMTKESMEQVVIDGRTYDPLKDAERRQQDELYAQPPKEVNYGNESVRPVWLSPRQVSYGMKSDGTMPFQGQPSQQEPLTDDEIAERQQTRITSIHKLENEMAQWEADHGVSGTSAEAYNKLQAAHLKEGGEVDTTVIKKGIAGNRAKLAVASSMNTKERFEANTNKDSAEAKQVESADKVARSLAGEDVDITPEDIAYTNTALGRIEGATRGSGSAEMIKIANQMRSKGIDAKVKGSSIIWTAMHHNGPLQPLGGYENAVNDMLSKFSGVDKALTEAYVEANKPAEIIELEKKQAESYIRIAESKAKGEIGSDIRIKEAETLAGMADQRAFDKNISSYKAYLASEAYSDEQAEEEIAKGYESEAYSAYQAQADGTYTSTNGRVSRRKPSTPSSSSTASTISVAGQSYSIKGSEAIKKTDSKLYDIKVASSKLTIPEPNTATHIALTPAQRKSIAGDVAENYDSIKDLQKHVNGLIKEVSDGAQMDQELVDAIDEAIDGKIGLAIAGKQESANESIDKALKGSPMVKGIETANLSLLQGDERVEAIRAKAQSIASEGTNYEFASAGKQTALIDSYAKAISEQVRVDDETRFAEATKNTLANEQAGIAAVSHATQNNLNPYVFNDSNGVPTSYAFPKNMTGTATAQVKALVARSGNGSIAVAYTNQKIQPMFVKDGSVTTFNPIFLDKDGNINLGKLRQQTGVASFGVPRGNVLGGMAEADAKAVVDAYQYVVGGTDVGTSIRGDVMGNASVLRNPVKAAIDGSSTEVGVSLGYTPEQLMTSVESTRSLKPMASMTKNVRKDDVGSTKVNKTVDEVIKEIGLKDKHDGQEAALKQYMNNPAVTAFLKNGQADRAVNLAVALVYDQAKSVDKDIYRDVTDDLDLLHTEYNHLISPSLTGNDKREYYQKLKVLEIRLNIDDNSSVDQSPVMKNLGLKTKANIDTHKKFDMQMDAIIDTVNLYKNKDKKVYSDLVYINAIDKLYNPAEAQYMKRMIFYTGASGMTFIHPGKEWAKRELRLNTDKYMKMAERNLLTFEERNAGKDKWKEATKRESGKSLKEILAIRDKRMLEYSAEFITGLTDKSGDALIIEALSSPTEDTLKPIEELF